MRGQMRINCQTCYLISRFCPIDFWEIGWICSEGAGICCYTNESTWIFRNWLDAKHFWYYIKMEYVYLRGHMWLNKQRFYQPFMCIFTCYSCSLIISLCTINQREPKRSNAQSGFSDCSYRIIVDSKRYQFRGTKSFSDTLDQRMLSHFK